MANKFKDGQKVTVSMKFGDDKEPRNFDAMILDQEQPGKYRIHTKMGVTMLVDEAAITAKEADGG